ncbi:SDR family oxidoreductase [Corynebacterium sp. CCM 8862]|uniref:SDR family oxidoreductase n=1 Tax=Corynebacterium mendelii TaxID=2765362 RepID=A0A939IXN2_9CORY|nr:SDR family oxidoreductase [Corynebacterium mendelii]
MPLGRAAKPEQIAEAVLFAPSAAGSYLTATTITVDGGRSVYSTGL